MSSPEDGSTEADRVLAERVAEAADRLSDGEPVDTDGDADTPGRGDAVRRLLPALEVMARLRDVPAPAEGPPGRTFGDFRTVRVIGRGGMGVVFEAVQISLNRRVALKTLPALVADDPALIERLLVEARAAARLQHPHIVPVIAVGQEGGVPYYAMQLVKGRTLAALIAESRRDEGAAAATADPGRRRIPPGLTAELGRQAAEALHHAHQHGVIHRDVKPGNLLVETSGRLWVADFGLARVLDGQQSTATDTLRGTLRYMSPEIASGGRAVVDERTDIYSLGATLYEMLALRPVFPGEDRLDLLRQIAWEEPRPPSRFDPAVPADLEAIVMKALAKDPAQRYASAGAMADDLRRFLGHEPVKARAPGVVRRWARRVRRTRRAVVLSAALVAAGVGLAAVWTQGLIARHQVTLTAALASADRQDVLNRRHEYNAQIRLAQQELDAGHVEFVQEVLERLRPGPGEPDPRGFEWHYLRRAAHRDVSLLFGHESPVAALAVAPDGRTLVSGDERGVLVFWDLPTWRERARTPGGAPWVHTIAFAPDGRTVASSHVTRGEPSEVRLWDPATARETARIARPGGEVMAIAFAHDARLLAVWEAAVGGRRDRNGVTFWRLGPDAATVTAVPGPPPGEGQLFAASPDRRLFATAGQAGVVTLRDAETGQARRTLPGTYALVSGIGFARDGRRLLVSHRDGLTSLATAANLKPTHAPRSPDAEADAVPSLTFDTQCLAGLPILSGRRYGLTVPGPGPRPTSLEETGDGRFSFLFSPDGSLIAGAGQTPHALLWETATGRLLRVFPPRGRRVASLAFPPRGESLFVAGTDSTIRAWRLARSPEPAGGVAGHGAEVWALAYTPDGSTLATAADDHTVKLWDARDGTPRGTLDGHLSLVSSLAVSPDGGTLASGGFDRTVRLWDLPSGRPRAVLRGHTDRVRGVAFSPDGRTLASGASDFTIRLWGAADGRALGVLRGHTDGLHKLAFHPDGSSLASAGNDATVRIWDPTGVRGPLTLTTDRANTALAFSRDGALLASGDDGGGLSVWDTGAWTRVSRAKGSDAAIYGLSFSGRSLAAASADAKVRLWDAETGQLTLVLGGHPSRVNCASFSPDGSTLASASHEGDVRFWHAGAR